MFESVLVANRGEIAVRIVRACRDAGVRSIAVYSDADSDAPHVQMADDAVRLGPPEVRDSYLSMERLIEVGRRCGAQALHPGYGLLSENGEFAAQVAAAGMVFVGPAPEVIELLGDKRTARAEAEAAGLPVLPARALTGGDVATLAAEVGYPLIVKAAFGGGGRGMRVVTGPGSLEEALAQAGRENRAAFGRAEAYLERLVPRARHIEVQILADAHGAVRHLGTRDCTVQRRNQKLVEEAPAFGLPPDLQARALDGAVRLARRVGYRGAGTVELLVDTDDAQLYFLEVNTRLQVEHTVTEMVTGIDIVAAQLAMASGEALGFAQEDVSVDGHAVEARVNAEDPATGFLPQTGTIQRLRLPAGPWVRVDGWIAEGTAVSAFYDSLLAKVAAWGPDRATATTRLARALGETAISGVPTTVAYLARVLGDERFRSGSHWTGMVDAGIVDASGLGDAIPGQPAPTTGAHRPVRIRTPVGEIRLDVPVQDRPALAPVRSATAGEDRLPTGRVADARPTGGTAPMDAVLVRHMVAVGDVVEEGTTVAIVESMKMETAVTSGLAGVVVAVHARPGDSLRRGQLIVTVEVPAP